MKYCIHCGTQINEEAKFCPACGKSVELTTIPSAQEANSASTGNSEEQSALASKILKKSIWALALSEFPVASIVGIFLAASAKKSAKKYAHLYGSLNGKAKAGNILANIALPVSIVMTVFWCFYILMIFGIIIRNFQINYGDYNGTYIFDYDIESLPTIVTKFLK